MSGGFDLTIIIEGHNIKEVAYFVSDKLSPLEICTEYSYSFRFEKIQRPWCYFRKWS